MVIYVYNENTPDNVSANSAVYKLYYLLLCAPSVRKVYDK